MESLPPTPLEFGVTPSIRSYQPCGAGFAPRNTLEGIAIELHERPLLVERNRSRVPFEIISPPGFTMSTKIRFGSVIDAARAARPMVSPRGKPVEYFDQF